MGAITIQRRQSADQQWKLVKRFILIGFVDRMAGGIHGMEVRGQRYGQLQVNISSEKVDIV
jgi:hypothetical protein